LGEFGSGRNNADLQRTLASILVVLGIIFAGFMLLSFPLGAYAFYNGNLSTSSSEPVIANIPVFVVGLPIDFPVRMTFADLFAALWVLYLALFVIALNGPNKSLWRTLKGLKSSDSFKISDNGLLVAIVAFTSVTLLTTLVEKLQSTVGVGSGALPEVDPMQTFVGIALAPITEEIGFRVSTIGLVAVTVLLGRSNFAYALKALWHPERYLGISSRRKNAVLKLIYAVAIISGLMFGLAHILFGAGWQSGKFTTSSIAGIALGLVYIKAGFPAAVLMHWSFNYYRSSYFYFEQSVGGTFIQDVMEYLLVITGAMSIAYLAFSRITSKPSTSLSEPEALL